MFDPVPALAERIVTAEHLLSIHRGDRDGARSRMSASFHGSSGGTVSFQVDGQVVR
ncbi:hypothetical protein [Actinomycetospora straminea]|uniref:Uncharacterized protein n=1 Tax=Actinomycetospora straminea TaxID=663607 RepID=A0ABP9F7V7_9PSEU|nr:hypothetical protein [Actinomycetospora straminea]MDD7936744.1 hypothetical protein [Actinomycetospora straminea]